MRLIKTELTPDGSVIAGCPDDEISTLIDGR